MQEVTIRPQEKAQTSTQTPSQVSLKKELAEGQLYQMQEKLQTTREGLGKYTDTKPSVIKKKAGRRPVLPNARET